MRLMQVERSQSMAQYLTTIYGCADPGRPMASSVARYVVNLATLAASLTASLAGSNAMRWMVLQDKAVETAFSQLRKKQVGAR